VRKLFPYAQMRPFLYLLILVAFGGLLFFSNIGGWDLWNPDEPRYAQIAREMLQGEGWIIPHLNSEVYYDKPPLFFWMIAGSAKLLREMNEAAARLPSAFFGLLTLILTFFFSKELFDERTGLFSALVLATSGEFFWLARRANIDATLTFFTTLTIYLFWTGYKGERGRRWLCYIGAYLVMATGFLVKLQPAVIVPFLAVGGYFLWKKESKFFADLAHIAGIALFMSIIGGWLYLAYLAAGKDYLQGLLFEKTALTFFKTRGHLRPFYYYLLNFPADFLPWTPFLPAAIYYGLKEEKEKTALLLLWFSLVFLFFSFAKAKRELYLLPIYPAAAIMVGRVWACFAGSEKWPKLLLWPLFLLILISLVVGLSSPFMSIKFGQPYFSNALEVGLFTASIFTGGGLLSLFLYRKEKKGTLFFVIVSMVFFLEIYGVFRIFPEVNRYKSARPLSQKIVETFKPGDLLGVYKLEGADINYYTGINPIVRIEEEGDLRKFLELERRALCVIKKRHFKKLSPSLKERIFIVAEGRIGHRRLFVISNRR